MASVIGRLRANVRNSAIGGTPAGIIFESWSSTCTVKGGSNGTIRGVTVSVTMSEKRTLRKPKRQSVPRPGRPVRGSDSGRPLMAALDLLGRRWALRILWSFATVPSALGHCANGARTCLPACSTNGSQSSTPPASSRQNDAKHYELTEIGRALGKALAPLDRWAQRWAQDR